MKIITTSSCTTLKEASAVEAVLNMKKEFDDDRQKESLM